MRHRYMAFDLNNSEISLSPRFSSASFNFVSTDSSSSAFFLSRVSNKSALGGFRPVERMYGAISDLSAMSTLEYTRACNIPSFSTASQNEVDASSRRRSTLTIW